MSSRSIEAVVLAAFAVLNAKANRTNTGDLKDILSAQGCFG